jgi:hypothetical protein
MIPLAALALAASALNLGELPPQKLVPGRCITFLWARTQPPRRVAMLTEAPLSLRVSHRGRVVDLPPGAEFMTFASADLIITLTIELTERAGGSVADGALRLEEPGKDVIVVPVAGLRACQ